jgi:hypothetical protein
MKEHQKKKETKHDIAPETVCNVNDEEKDDSFEFINELNELNEQDVNEDNLPNGIISDLTNEIIQYISTIIYRPTNTKKIKQVFSYLTKCLLEHIYVYLYTIMALLIIIFIMNCSQFYYIIKNHS